VHYLTVLSLFSILAISGCSTIQQIKTELVGSDEGKGKYYELKYVDSTVFDKTLAMYALQSTTEMDVQVSKGMSINNIPTKLDNIFVAAVDNGAEFNLIDERYEVKMRSVIAITALISAYSNYKSYKDTYQQYVDEKARSQLGDYIINVYYNADSGDISHIKFTRKEIDE
jgi:hypothetical protein